MNTVFFFLAPSNMASIAMYVPVRPTPALSWSKQIRDHKRKMIMSLKEKKIQPTSNFEFLCGPDAVNAVYTTLVVPTFYPTEVRVGFRILKIIYCIIFNAYWSPSSLYQTFRHYLTSIWMLTAANPCSGRPWSAVLLTSARSSGAELRSLSFRELW